MVASPALLLGVDGGQTATKALVATIDGTILGGGRSGPSDHFHGPGGEETNRRAIHGAITAALAAASAAPSRIAAIGLGLTGAPTGGEQTPIVERIVREILTDTHIAVAADYVTNLAGASAGGSGVVVVAGGGAIAYGIDEAGHQAIAGGFGYLLGDEGSAFDIGRRAIIAAARASDGRGPATTLEGVVRTVFDLGQMRDITRRVYRAGFGREQISMLAPRVIAAAAEGDGVASDIARSAGEELGLAAAAVLHQLGLGSGAAVYPTGGVFSAGPIILSPFAAAIASRVPGASIEAPRFPPLVGALILARRSLELAIDEPWLAAVSGSLIR